ncbi:m-AAA protease-interacting protein 1, mitochondrial [Osmerus mordax]|uniref:m-AAA protease-interacting protein 1, mitochondrial n=1 Tax=Osmerus mordax TaxID=8014 RepID=UPI00350E9D66
MMQRITSFATYRQLGGIATRQCFACPWKKHSPKRPQCCTEACMFSLWSTSPLVRDPVSFNCGLYELRRQSTHFAFQNYRHYCTSDNDRKSTKGHPTISVVGSPDPITWIINKLFIILIELVFELGLTTVDFDNGVKQALVHVSNMMSTGNFEELRGVVSNETVDYVEKKCKTLSEAQRQQLAISLDDILFLLPEDVCVVFDKRGGRSCVIEMRFWYLSKTNAPDDPESSKIFKIATTEDSDKSQKIVTAVYEFHRELTKGADSNWTITNIWHWDWGIALKE